MDRDTTYPDERRSTGETTRRWIEYERSHAATSTHVFDVVWDVEAEADGPFFTDVDGNVVMDFTSQVAAAPLGFNNPAVTDRMREFDLNIDPLKFAGSAFYAGTSTEPEEASFPGPAVLMDRLIETTEHLGMDSVFLSNSGAEAVENAIKICYADTGHRGFCFSGAFHGRTLGALSLNRSKASHRRGYPEIPGIVSLPFCSCESECRCGWRTNGPGGNALADALHSEQGVLEPTEVAYVIIEPIQGEGGYRIPSEQFIADVTSTCAKHDIHLIADEIQTGLGRTGEVWASDTIGIKPDVLTCGKGLRVGGTVAAGDVFPDEPSRIASTWGSGDIIASLQGAVTLDVVMRESMLRNVRRRGQQFRETLHDEVAGEVQDIRGHGLMLAVEFESKEHRDSVQKNAVKLGLLTLGCGHRTLRVLPPLDVTEREIEIGAELLIDAIDRAE